MLLVSTLAISWAMSPANESVLIDTGNLTDRTGRQAEMKAETMAQALAKMDAAAIALTAQDARLGKGTLSSIARLSCTGAGQRVAQSILQRAPLGKQIPPD